MHSLFLIFVLTIPSSENENFYTQLLGYTNVYISSRRRISRVLNLLSHYKKNWSVYTKMLSKKLECCSFQYPSFEFSADELENRTIFLIRRRTVHLNYSFDLTKLATCTSSYLQLHLWYIFQNIQWTSASWVLTMDQFLPIYKNDVCMLISIAENGQLAEKILTTRSGKEDLP